MLFINVTGKNWLMQMVHTYMQDETRIASAAICRNWCGEWKARALHYPPPYLHTDHCECLRPSYRCPESITCVTPATRGPAVNPRLTLGTHHRHHHTILLFDNILNWELFSEKFSCDQATMYNFCTIQIYICDEKKLLLFSLFSTLRLFDHMKGGQIWSFYLDIPHLLLILFVYWKAWEGIVMDNTILLYLAGFIDNIME